MTDRSYPCHLYGIQDAKEAYEAIDVTCIKEYGKEVSLEDGTVLHENCPVHRDDGRRYITRCNVCGGLMLVQSSMEDCPYWDDPDLYFRDCIPVATVEEADLLNILWDEKELPEYPFRHLRRDDLKKLWTKGKEPVSYEPENLRNRIRMKYSALPLKQKKMLEKLMSEAGKGQDA